ncbi:MAG: metallophosphoesterase family protein [Cryomorphaceae bacterium]|nr:metallophosphoesterase family protein [Cryomorphaceae bacterium]
MKRILLLSDTHGFLDPALLKFAREADEIWHAGDIGPVQTLDPLLEIAPIRAVWGNIDGQDVRALYPKDQKFILEDTRVWITHIGGHPKRYAPGISAQFVNDPVDLFICGHSHIVKAGFDQKYKHLHLNPGAAGKQGWQKYRTAMRFSLEGGKVKALDLITL